MIRACTIQMVYIYIYIESRLYTTKLASTSAHFTDQLHHTPKCPNLAGQQSLGPGNAQQFPPTSALTWYAQSYADLRRGDEKQTLLDSGSTECLAHEDEQVLLHTYAIPPTSTGCNHRSSKIVQNSGSGQRCVRIVSDMLQALM